MARSTTNNVLEGISFEEFQGLVELMPKCTEAVTQHLSSLIFFFNLSVCFSLEHLSLMLFIPPPLSHWVQTCFIFFLFSQIHQPVLLAVCPQASLNESWVLGTADWLVGVYAIIIEMILRQFWLCGRSDFMPYRCKHSESQVNSNSRLHGSKAVKSIQRIVIARFSCWCGSAAECRLLQNHQRDLSA